MENFYLNNEIELTEQISEDIDLAKKVKVFSKSKYSNYSVGAVLKCKNGKKYLGCNIENYGIQSICAERVAFAKAISEGENEFESILIIGSKNNSNKLEKCLPCGYCRQFIIEFVEKKFEIITAYNVDETSDYIVEKYTIEELLPGSFRLK